MQFKYILTVIFFSLILLLPLKKICAESQHFNKDQAKKGFTFVSQDQVFELEIGAGVLSQPVDVYLFKKPGIGAADLNALTDIYAYYIYSSEVSDTTELKLTISYNGDGSGAKTVYYYNQQNRIWSIASNKAFINSLSFGIKGKKNQLVVAGTNLADNSTVDEASSVALPIYKFDVDSPNSELSVKKVCLPYLTGYFRSSADNDRNEVKKLQVFLNKFEGNSELPSTGYYGIMTYQAVKRFQEKYSADILSPWDLKQGTGWILQTTLDKINKLYCEVYNQDDVCYQLTIPYEIPEKLAKNAYYLDRNKNQEGDWIKLDSFDNSAERKVTAIISKTAGEVTLFRASDQWVGEASWYSWKNGLYAASRDFPKGIRLKVTNQSDGENQGKSVIVTVNDYGPELWTGRIIDLDKAAYAKIANLKGGVMPVKVEVYKD